MLRGRSVMLAALLGLTAIAPARADCDAKPWVEYNGVQLWRLPGTDAYFYATKRVAIDADGAPNAYHPDDIGLDANANAGYPSGGWRSVLVVDPADGTRPYVQTTGEFAGYFVSKTSLQDARRAGTDPQRYVDAGSVAYVVFPGQFHAMEGTGSFGDVAMVRNLNNQNQSAAIVADLGPFDAGLGEMSIRLAATLGGSNVNPRTGAGAPAGTFAYVVFPKSRAEAPWPLAPEQLNELAARRLAELGGWDRIAACLR